PAGTAKSCYELCASTTRGFGGGAELAPLVTFHALIEIGRSKLRPYVKIVSDTCALSYKCRTRSKCSEEQRSEPLAASLPPPIRHVDQRRCLALGRLWAAVVARSGLHVAVRQDALHRHHVRARVKQVTGQSAAQVVRRKMVDARFDPALLQQVVDRLAAETARRHLATLVDRPEQRPRLVSPHAQPVVQG